MVKRKLQFFFFLYDSLPTSFHTHLSVISVFPLSASTAGVRSIPRELAVWPATAYRYPAGVHPFVWHSGRSARPTGGRGARPHTARHAERHNLRTPPNHCQGICTGHPQPRHPLLRPRLWSLRRLL